MQRSEAQVVAQALAQDETDDPLDDAVAQVVAQPSADESDYSHDEEADDAPVAFCGDASLRFACRIVRDHGRPRRDGLVQVDRSVRQLAQDHGLSPGTVQSRLRELDAHGVRCSARPTVIDPDRLDALLSPTTPRSTASSPTPGERRSLATLEAPHPDPADDTSRLLSLAAELTATDPSMLDLATEIAQRALTALAATGRATAARPARAESRDSARFISEGMNEMDDENQHSSLHSSSEEAKPRARTRTDEPRESRDDERLLDLVAPLATACDELGLPGVTHLTGLRAALEPFCDESVSCAVRRLTAEARAGLRTPMGKLVNMARARDRSYFSLPPARDRATAAVVERAPAAIHGHVGIDWNLADDVGHVEEVERLPPGEANKRVAAIRQQLAQGTNPGGHA